MIISEIGSSDIVAFLHTERRYLMEPGRTSKWWPMLASVDPKQIEWCPDPTDNVRARFQGETEWRYMRGEGVRAESAYFKGIDLLETGRSRSPDTRALQRYIPQ